MFSLWIGDSFGIRTHALARGIVRHAVPSEKWLLYIMQNKTLAMFIFVHFVRFLFVLKRMIKM